ncbi:MAG TPA: hypothetical protein VFB14_21530 [Bryobacteraceae bacterium]|nr:hypothetical protein [Bryobacteraceae bacterium]
MKFRLGLLVVSFALALQAQMQMNVQQLADFIRSELALKQQSDKKIGEYVKKIQLTERLTDKTITDLEAQGAGPRTVEALKYLRDKTANLKPPTKDATYSPATAPDNTLSSTSATTTLKPQAPPIPPPSSVKQQEIRDLMTQYALNYTQNLPNFICVEVTRRYVDPRGGNDYRSLGTVLARVSYNEGAEHYKVYSVDGKIVDTDMGGIGGGGARSTGEFAGMMRSIFEPKSEAEFGWDHWATLRGRRMAVFNYFIDSGHSSYSIEYGGSGGPGDEQRIITAYRGLIYADPDTGEIDRIKFIAVNIPSSFPVRETTETLDYDLIDISGQKFVCPTRALLYMRAEHQTSRNEIEFRNYRKFGADIAIKYDMDPNAPPPMPPSETEEQPATASQPAKAPAPKKESTSDPWTLPTPPPPPPR